MTILSFLKHKYVIISVIAIIIIIIAVFIIALIYNPLKPKAKDEFYESLLTTIKTSPPTVTGLDNTPITYTGTVKFDADNIVSGSNFTYALKEHYNSRKEVSDELESLHRAFNSYSIKFLHDEQVDIARKEYKRLIEYLEKWLEIYPKTEKEKYDDNVEMFYKRIESSLGDVQLFYKICRDKPSSDWKSYNEFKEKYENELKIKEDFESGKITIIEALELIGLGEKINR